MDQHAAARAAVTRREPCHGIARLVGEPGLRSGTIDYATPSPPSLCLYCPTAFALWRSLLSMMDRAKLTCNPARDAPCLPAPRGL